jgi:two-component system sensor histidine kinase/response regulator
MSVISGKTSEDKFVPGNVITDKTDIPNKDILNMINCPTILTGMSHEMRTHMNSIVAFSFLMNNGGCGDGERNEYSNQILSSCEQLMVLFDNFLDSAIIDTGNSKAEPRTCNLGNILDDLLSEFRVILKREDHKELVLILENQEKRQSEILIDSNRVSRVIRSLFQNSLHNTKSGYIKIGYYFRDGNVTFYVLDSGNGYQKCREFLNSKNLNESLRLHDDTSSAINLTLARKLISLMEGSIWVESNGPAGTGMYFSIPAREADAPKVTLNHYNNTRIAI